ncbi:hypothetical protein ACXR2T_02300 [Leucobacter sp. HY1910]
MIIDAGPALNFIAAGYQQLLLDVISAKSAFMCAPQSVADEVQRKSHQPHGSHAGTARFHSRHWHVFEALVSNGLVKLLIDDVRDKALVAATVSVSKQTVMQRALTSKDLGETMVVAHALKMARIGKAVIVLVDDGGGQRLARQHGLKVTSTLGILRDAARLGMVETRGDMKLIYARIAQYDDGLPHWDTSVVSVLHDRELYIGRRAAPL